MNIKEISAFAAAQAQGQLNPHTVPLEVLNEREILIKVSHCGICHSDIHLIDNDWHFSRYPLVPGHEIIGEVILRGRKARRHQEGARIGVGWQAASCQHCEWCRSGAENLCEKNEGTCVNRPGGYADYLRVDERFAFTIPENLDSAQTAPLLCGGITVYAPLRHYEVKPSMHVAVMGMGGLGHLAVQFSRAWGCAVTVLSSSPDKEADARSFGANDFILESDRKALRSLRRKLDVIFMTASANAPWSQLLELLRPNGRVVILGAAPDPVSVPASALIGKQVSVSGSVIGGTLMIEEMLSFASRHSIGAQIELMPLAEVNAALHKVRENAVRYRMVLECAK